MNMFGIFVGTPVQNACALLPQVKRPLAAIPATEPLTPEQARNIDRLVEELYEARRWLEAPRPGEPELEMRLWIAVGCCCIGGYIDLRRAGGDFERFSRDNLNPYFLGGQAHFERVNLYGAANAEILEQLFHGFGSEEAEDRAVQIVRLDDALANLQRA